MEVAGRRAFWNDRIGGEGGRACGEGKGREVGWVGMAHICCTILDQLPAREAEDDAM